MSEDDNLDFLVARLRELDEAYLAQREEITIEALGRQLKQCAKCGRHMLGRRVWDKLSFEVRKQIRKHINRVGTGDNCATCVAKKARVPLSDEEVERLQKLVGVVK
jgi:hypothetical protein